MHLSTLSEWLNYLGSVHRRDIELGIDRVKTVAARLDLLSPQIPVIIVGGTNGKGSVVAGLNAIYRQAGFHVGTFTSPYLFQHNEEVIVDDEMARDEEFCSAFATIEKARAEISLTPFEFHTLAALLIFRARSPLDIMILEVGLGGRLDAVNIIDADVAIIASVDIDHVDWLGNTREAIGREKAGIFRADKPAICGDFNPPLSLLARADEVKAPFYRQGKDFYFNELNYAADTVNAADGARVKDGGDLNRGRHWSWQWQQTHFENLPQNALMTQNMSTALMAVTLLQKKLPVTPPMVRAAFNGLSLPGRVQIVKRNQRTIIFDVAHNPAACAHLAKRLRTMAIKGRVIAVFAMLADKEISASVHHLRDVIDDWYIAELSAKRAANTDILKQALAENGIQKNVHVCAAIEEAYQQALRQAQQDDAVIVFGSFYTVASVAVMPAQAGIEVVSAL